LFSLGRDAPIEQSVKSPAPSLDIINLSQDEPISNAHLFSFIHLVMLFCSYVMKHLGATAPGSEEGGAQGAADGAQIEEEQQQY